MKPISRFSSFLGAALVLALILGCKGEAHKAAQQQDTKAGMTVPQSNKGQAYVLDEESTPNILQIALGSPDHKTLVAAVQAAGLENAPVNAGPLMAFAPPHQAFPALPEGTCGDPLKAGNNEALVNILQYHVTAGNYSKDFLMKFKKLGQANNQDAPIEILDGEVMVAGAKIIASIPAGNGIVHIVDKVLLPPTP